jgi:GYF domain 2
LIGSFDCVGEFMGIRFFCPNGHRLHVKTFLAGKRGVCPDCGLGVSIPYESDPKALKKKTSGADDLYDGDPETVFEPELPAPTLPTTAQPISVQMPVLPSLDPLTVPGVTAAVPTSIAPVVVPNVAIAGAKPSIMPYAVPAVANVTQPVIAKSVVPMAATPVAMANPTIPAYNAPAKPVSVATTGVMPPPAFSAIPDPIAEAPMGVWYVRPTVGGQFGPARGDVMRQWIADGRVSSDALVWREGWPDWRVAAKVFPNLAGVATSVATPDLTPLIPENHRKIVRPQPKSSSGIGIVIVIVLALVAVGLAVALIYVLRGNS